MARGSNPNLQRDVVVSNARPLRSSGASRYSGTSGRSASRYVSANQQNPVSGYEPDSTWDQVNDYAAMLLGGSTTGRLLVGASRLLAGALGY